MMATFAGRQSVCPLVTRLVFVSLVALISHLNAQFQTPVLVEAMMTAPLNLPSKRSLPPKLLIGYGTNCENVRKAVQDGVNVVIWAFLDIVSLTDDDADGSKTSTHRELMESSADDSTRKGRIKTDLDLVGIHQLIQELDQSGYNHVIHLVSFGGWNGPHLDSRLSAEEWYRCWKESETGSLFHGIDWDLEGHDDLSRPTNVFTIDCLDKMGHISRMMKEDGYFVGMAPPQSYMNFDNPHFSRYVNLTEPSRPWHPEFHYFGANVYSYILAKFGDHIDFVSMQLYESFSLAAMAVHFQRVNPEDYLFAYIEDFVVKQESKFYVDFPMDKEVSMQGQYVHLPLSKLVIGLANGWAADPENRKHIFVTSDQVEKAYIALKQSPHGDLSPRGFMFWTIEEEGTRNVYLARDLHNILQKC